MVRLDPPLRLATEADRPVLAVLNNEASHGLALHAWGLMADPGTDPLAFGAARQTARIRDRQWVVVDEGAGPVAGLMARPAEADPPRAGLPAIFPPMIELEALAPAALFIHILATLPDARGRGFGTRLLQLAEAMARDERRPAVSLIVADDNAGARRIYVRHGFERRGSREMAKAGWDGPGEAWLLLVKALT